MRHITIHLIAKKSLSEFGDSKMVKCIFHILNPADFVCTHKQVLY